MCGVSTLAAAKVPDALWRRLTEFATGVVESDTMTEQLMASQDLLEQVTLIRRQLVLDASNKGMSVADIGKALDMSPEGARKIRLAALAALKELDR